MKDATKHKLYKKMEKKKLTDQNIAVSFLSDNYQNDKNQNYEAIELKF